MKKAHILLFFFLFFLFPQSVSAYVNESDNFIEFPEIDSRTFPDWDNPDGWANNGVCDYIIWNDILDSDIYYLYLIMPTASNANDCD